MQAVVIALAVLTACQFDTGAGSASADGSIPAIDARAPADAANSAPDAPVIDIDGSVDAPDAATPPLDATPPDDAEPGPVGLVTTGAATTVGALGGTGGSPFTEDCPDERVVTGFFAKDNSFGLTRLGATCSAVTIDTAGDVTIGDPVQTDTHGSESSVVDTPPIDCPGGAVVVGVSGTWSSSELVHSIRIRCAALTWDGADYALGSPSEVAMSLGSPSGSGGSNAENCPAGEVGGGFSGRAGTILDRFELRCFGLAAVDP